MFRKTVFTIPLFQQENKVNNVVVKYLKLHGRTYTKQKNQQIWKS